mgnify:CR=1 FL=1
MIQFQQNIFRLKTTTTVANIPILTIQNIDNTTDCGETGEILITGATPNSVVRLQIESNPTTEGTATFTYNAPIENTIHDSSVIAPVYIDVNTDGTGAALITYIVDADPNNDLEGTYVAEIIIVDGTNTQIGVSSVTISDICTTIGVGGITLDDAQTNVNNCTDCKTVTVTVPSGSTYEIDIAKTGAGPWASGTLTACQNGTSLSTDQVFTITSSETFRFGVDAAGGNLAATTQITFIVRDGVAGPILGTEVLSRTHSNPVTNC